MRRSRRLLFFALLLMATLAGLAPDDCETLGNSLLGGGSGGSSPTPPTDVTWFKLHGGEYSFDDDDCGDRVDPITVVVRRNGAAIVDHVAHHGIEGVGSPPRPEPLNVDVHPEPFPEPLPDGEGRQRYKELWDDFGTPIEICVWGQVSQASSNGYFHCDFNLSVCPLPRWHTRCNVVATSPDPAGGTWATCTPHYDESGGGRDGFGCWHFVPAVFLDRWDGPGGIPAGISGFNAGQRYLRALLVVEGGHRSMGAYYYGNDQEMHQCNGDPNQYGGQGDWTSSDGYVRFIEVLP